MEIDVLALVYWLCVIGFKLYVHSEKNILENTTK